MDKFKTIKGIKKFKKIVFRSILGLILLLLILGIALSLPVVQTKIGAYLTEIINKDYKTDIKVEQVAVSIFGGIKLKNVIIRDHHKDTLIAAHRIKTDVLSFKKLYNGDLLFGDIRIDHLVIQMKTYKGEKDTNLDKFIALFDSGKASTKKFLMKAKNLYVDHSRFILIDENIEALKTLDLTKLDSEISNFMVYGPDVTMNIKKMAFRDHRGLYVENLSSNFTYTKKYIKLESLDVLTKQSYIKGTIILNYERKDFSDFNNKVQFDIKLDSASLATNDISHYYKELERNQHFSIRTTVKGTLNDFYATNLKLVDDHHSQIIGDVNFRNLFGKKGQNFYMKGSFDKVSSNYKNLTSLLPNILGKKLPSSLSKLGQFNLRGKAEITTTSIDADFYMSTALGNIQSDLLMSNINNIDNASYSGNVILENFNIGAFLDKKDLGTVTLNLDVDGKGFKEKYLNTSFTGDIYRVYYKGYNYKNIVVNGNFKQPIFKGKLFINDPNLQMDFDGLVNLGQKDVFFDFKTKIDYANLINLKLVKTDSLSIFKGNVDMKISGNTLDDMQGDIYITKTSYQNKKDIYLFDDFTIKSSFDENRVRTIAINSPDIIEGQIVGKFQFGQLQKMVENSLGSLYANYTPNKVKKGQFLKFDFAIYNKVVEIFYPGISIGSNTVMRGNINSDNDEFKFNFTSPKIAAFDNYFDEIKIEIDNKNPLYNAYIQMDSIKTKYYKVSDFSLINVTMNDTLFLRTEFKGGNKAEDYYNLNLFHTIDKKKNSVVGIQKSEIMFKDYLWYLNENDEENNKIVFDKALKNFAIDDIVMSHENQKIELNGLLKGTTYKDLNLSFTDIDLSKLTPDIEQFKIKGSLNGDINFKQNNNVYQPTSSLTVDSLNVNNNLLGKLKLDIVGDENLKKFSVNSTIENDNVESFTAKGDFSIENKETVMDLDMRFSKFNLGALSLLGGDIITNIKGFVSGTTSIEGTASNPDINGRLYLDEAGLTIPYMNVSYELEKSSIVDVTESLFIIRDATLTDTKYNTKGILDGRIKHKKFSEWDLDLRINSSRLLALDTKDSEDAAYYGTAFIDGTATISGPTNGLFIKVDAKSEKGTAIKIPINDADAVGTSSYIHFLSSTEKFNLGKGIVEKNRNYNGLELEFDLDINQNAEIEVILDRNSGHGIKGRGRGGLLLKINTLGKFNMYGDFQIYEGTYNFKYGGLIDKKFIVKKFGSIVWEGDPMRAILNLEAIYKTTANPAVLLENPSFNRKVPVEVVIGVRGSLSNPELDFNIEFPTVSSILKSEIQYKLDDRDTRQTQALYLLSSGGFLSPEGVNQADFAGNLFERASGLFQDIFKDEEGVFNVGLDYVSADKRPGTETDARFGVTVSTKINERIMINGKLGVPVGGVNESAIVGDVEVQYRVNEDGTLNLRMFNRENDINYFGQGIIGYTQGVGVTYEVDFDTFKELVNKIFKNKLDKESKPTTVDPDSDLPPQPDYINFQKGEKKEKEKIKVNQDAVPEEE
ncbi:translocation/assembly module TamB domain-containing protein [Flavobacterium sp. GT3R68]|uniref:translocation/assembly module TamB domain-containing protein n=1 Tax=Flavobacterium sp. GT3R68 TaxID=2594437 RepID=UPI0021032F1A|nr:translocation/assembly module TamB domain-containing protein [Flavobacterium sp. GT3R68]